LIFFGLKIATELSRLTANVSTINLFEKSAMSVGPKLRRKSVSVLKNDSVLPLAWVARRFILKPKIEFRLILEGLIMESVSIVYSYLI
jgi:hypothetical protein